MLMNQRNIRHHVVRISRLGMDSSRSRLRRNVRIGTSPEGVLQALLQPVEHDQRQLEVWHKPKIHTSVVTIARPGRSIVALNKSVSRRPQRSVRRCTVPGHQS